VEQSVCTIEVKFGIVRVKLGGEAVKDQRGNIQYCKVTSGYRVARRCQVVASGVMWKV